MDKLKKYLPLVAVILAVVAVAMMFLPAFEGNSEIKGFNAVFGYSLMGFKLLDFSFMNLIPYVLLIVGIACAGMVSKKEDNFVISIVAAVCMLVAGIFFFMTPNFCNPAVEGAKLGTGLMLSAICSIAGAVCVVIPAILKKLGK